MRFKQLFALLLTSKALLVLLILYGPFGLTGDEAQYWTWSQELSYGYFSKPPAIAWQIAATTYLFGSTELGVRLGALLLSSLTALIIYKLARDRDVDSYAAIAFLLSPLGGLSSLFATTDGGFILFFLLAFLMAEKNHPLLVGISIGMGGLWKWMCYVAWVALLQGQKKYFFALLISIFALLPPLVWNWEHNFVTFKHVAGNIFGETTLVQRGLAQRNLGNPNPLEYMGGLIALFSPLFVLLAFLGLKTSRGIKTKEIHARGVQKIVYFSLCFLVGSLLYATLKKCQVNWGIPGLIGLFLPLGAAALRWKRLFYSGVILSLALQVLAVLVPFRYSPFKSCLGLHAISSLLQEQGYDPAKDYLMGDKYQTVSQLSFYGAKQKRAYFLNLLGSRENQFSYWPGIEAEEQVIARGDIQGSSRGYFVAFFDHKDFKSIEYWKKEYPLRLVRYFDSIELLGCFPLYSEHGEVQKQALLIRTSNSISL